MPRTRWTCALFVLSLATLSLATLCLGACGDDAPPRDPAADALGALAAAMTQGQGMDDPSWPDLVQRAGLALWPGRAADDVAALSTRKTHTELSHIAGDLARSLAQGDEERRAWTERDPESVAIHDAFVAAAARGADPYRAWVEGEGAALLRRRIERLTAPPR